MLLAYDVDPNLQSTYDDTAALMMASYQGILHVVRMLLEYNMDPNLWNDKGETALMRASRYGYSEIV